MTLRELPKPPAKPAAKPEKMVMHGLDTAAVYDPNELFIHLGPDGKVLGVGPEDADFSKFGKTLRKMRPPKNMDLDNLPDKMPFVVGKA